MPIEEVQSDRQASARRQKTVRVRVTPLGQGIIHTGEIDPHRARTFSENDAFDCPVENVEVFEVRGWVERAQATATTTTTSAHAQSDVSPPPKWQDSEAAYRLSLRSKRDDKTGC